MGPCRHQTPGSFGVLHWRSWHQATQKPGGLRLEWWLKPPCPEKQGWEGSGAWRTSGCFVLALVLPLGSVTPSRSLTGSAR